MTVKSKILEIDSNSSFIGMGGGIFNIGSLTFYPFNSKFYLKNYSFESN